MITFKYHYLNRVYDYFVQNFILFKSPWFLFCADFYFVFWTFIHCHQKILAADFIIPLSIANGLASQFLNAWFLNTYGVQSTAIVTSDIETNSTLNNKYIHEYEAIVKKQNGQYVETNFSTMSAAIYPIENAIKIPDADQEFPVKFIPGYEKNIVILYQQSDEGKKLQQYKLQEPINSAKIKYEADPINKDFIEEYISALEDYLKVHDNVEYRTKINHLKKEAQALKK